MRAIIVATLLLSSGCTFEDGQGWARLSSWLWTSFQGFDSGSGRLGADGWFKTNNSFELKITSLRLGVQKLQAQSLGSSSSDSSGDCTFDPANPPAGCSLCHGGHCHCDGQLKSYDELKKEICGSGSTSTTVSTLATMPVNKLQSLMGNGTQTDKLGCSESCELSAGQLDRMQAALDRLTLSATLRDLSVEDRLNGEQLSVSVDLKLSGAALTQSLTPAQKMDQDTPYFMDLAVRLPVTEKLLDGIDWHKLTRSGDSITIDATNNPKAGEAIASNLALTALAVTAQRSNE
jgi:hypothetical protein